MSEFLNSVGKALNDERWDDLEEAWLDAMEKDEVPFHEYLKAGRRAADGGEGSRLGSILALLAPQAENLSVDLKTEYYEILATCVPKEREYREILIDLYRQSYGEKGGFETFIKTADIMRTPDPARAIANFSNIVKYLPGSFVYHRSGWGVGEIVELIAGEGLAVIDFIEKPGHRIQLSALPDICEQLPAQHFLVLAWKDPEGLATLLDERPTELIKSILRSSKRPIPLSRIREQLIGKVIPAGSWSKWWTRTRNQLKKDPEVAVTSKKTPEYFLLEGPEGIAASLERRLANQDLKSQIRIVREAVTETSEDDLEALAPSLDKIKKEFQRTDGPPALLLEALLFLRHRGIDLEGLPTVAEILGRCEHPGNVINLLGRQNDQKEIIDLLRSQDEEGWEKMHTDLILMADDPPRRYLIQLMHDEHRDQEIDNWAKEVSRLPKKAPLYYLWLVRRIGFHDVEGLPSLEGMNAIDVFLKALSLLNDYSVRHGDSPTPELALIVKRYKQHLGSRPFKLLINVVKHGELSSVRNVYHAIDASSGFSGTTRQGLLAAILREQPDVLASSDLQVSSEVDDSTIYATDAGIERKRKELEIIRNEKLPAIFKLIGEAAEFGDLSENAEFISAVEERENLNRRAMEIQAQLDIARRIDPSEASTDHVTLGSRVKLTHLGSGETLIYSILGPWDGGPEENVLSYMSPLGRAVLDQERGEEFEVELPDGKSNYRVEDITRHGEDQED